MGFNQFIKFGIYSQSRLERLFFSSWSPGKVFELNIYTLTSIRYVSLTYSGLGVGGIKERLYNISTTSTGDNERNELNIATLATINTLASDYGSAKDIGGIADKLYYSEGDNNRVFEVNKDTLATLGSAICTIPNGTGGIYGRLYYGEDPGADNKLHELNPSTLAILSTVSAPSSYTKGMGGINERLFTAYSGNDTIYEINPDTLASIGSYSAPVDTFASGIGGIKI